MASPSAPSREARARLIREMSQSLRASRSSPLPHPSSQNNTNTLPSIDLDQATDSSFNPAQDDVLESTRNNLEEDDTQPITNMRSSAARYRYWQPPKPEQRVDTSQVDQHFHDFDDDASFEQSKSLEFGRAQNKSNRSTPNKLQAEMSPHDFSIGNDSLYNLSEAARTRSRATPRKSDGAERGDLRRDAQLRRATSLPQKDLEGIAARLGRNGERISPAKNATPEKRKPTLAQMHARLTEEDSSFIDERPPTVTLTAKNTRFGNPRSRQGSGVFNDMTAQTPQRSIYATPRSVAPGTATQQSFQLPDLPNLTELVSGTYQDGTPVFSRAAKARSRFSSAPIPSRLREETTDKHMPIENVPIPAEEKALYTSLQLLKERLAQMEQDKAEAEKRMEDYESEVAYLRTELSAREEMRRSDSALGSTDGEGSKKENWRAEKTRLESQINSLRSRLERAERKSTVSEIATKRVTDERDNAVTQLGVAFLNSEELKEERDALQAENETLRAELDALRNQNEELQIRLSQYEGSQRSQKASRRDATLRKENETLHAEIQKFTEREAHHEEETQGWARHEARLRQSVEKSQEAAREAQEVIKELMNSKRANLQRLPRTEHAQTETQAFSTMTRRRSSSRKRQEPLQRSNSNPKSRPPVQTDRRSASAPQPYVSDVDDSMAESTTDLDAINMSRSAPPAAHGGFTSGLVRKAQEHTGDTTELSFMGRDEIARLRKTLEEERAAARRNARSGTSQTQQRDDTMRSQNIARKTSMKDLTSASRPMDLTEANTGRILSENLSMPASPVKDETQQSMHSQQSNRRRRSAPVEMTSAFILPDITINTRSIPRASTSHNDANCTVCRKASCSGEHVTPINIPKPVPVSERMPDDVDATMRPSQPAPLALATVIKELQDELTHLNLQKSAYDSLLRSHDPSLSRRKRKAVEAKVADLLQAISHKSDQIYALYDVVEGQKAAGQLDDEATNAPDEQQIEETLLSVGIDPEEMRQKTNKSNGKRVQIEEREQDSEIGGITDDEELPWEGISESESLPSLNGTAGWKRKAVY